MNTRLTHDMKVRLNYELTRIVPMGATCKVLKMNM